MGSGAKHDPSDVLGGWCRHLANLTLGVARIEHRVGLFCQRRVRPVINPPGLRQHNVPVVVFAGNPIGVFRRQIAIRRIVHIYQFKPAALGDFPLVQIQQLAEVVPQPQTKTHAPCRLVAFENKPGEELGRTMLDSQRVR